MMQWLLPSGGWLMVGERLRAVFLLPARFAIRSETVEISTKSIGRRQTIRTRFILSQEWIDIELEAPHHSLVTAPRQATIDLPAYESNHI